jgi:hypothetical protein
VTKFFAQHKAPETTKGVEAGIEKLRINQAFLKRIGSSEKMVEVQGQPLTAALDLLDNR